MDTLKISAYESGRRCCRLLAIGGFSCALLLVTADVLSPSMSTTLGGVSLFLGFAGLMVLPLYFIEHTVLLTPEGICIISRYRCEMVPWADIAGSRVTTDYIRGEGSFPSLHVYGKGGTLFSYGVTALGLNARDVALAINGMKAKYGRANKARSIVER